MCSIKSISFSIYRYTTKTKEHFGNVPLRNASMSSPIVSTKSTSLLAPTRPMRKKSQCHMLKKTRQSNGVLLQTANSALKTLV